MLSIISQHQLATCFASDSSKPRVVIEGVPIRIPLVIKGDCGSFGTAFLLTVIFADPNAASRIVPLR